MPSKSLTFTPLSILFRPHEPATTGVLVETPGTAPGSNRFITLAVYRHSRCRQALYRRGRGTMQTGLWKAAKLATESR